MDRSGIALIIPAYNEAATIYAVVKSASRYGQPIVIDDCSTDATADLAERAGAVVLSHVSNRGYDGALNTGFAEADRREFDAIITLDADGQHDPELLSRFIDELDQGADLVLGVRDRFPRCAERVFALYTRHRYGVHDPLCGMKAYRRLVYQRLGHFDSYQSIGTELALFGVKSNFSFREIAFKVRDRQDSPRFGRLFSANLRILRAMMRDMFRA